MTASTSTVPQSITNSGIPVRRKSDRHTRRRAFTTRGIALLRALWRARSPSLRDFPPTPRAPFLAAFANCSSAK